MVHQRVWGPFEAGRHRRGRAVGDGPGRPRGRAVSDVAAGLGADWHAINDAVMAYGAALLAADVDRVGTVDALGVDEVLFARFGRWRTQAWSTSIVDVAGGQLLDVIEGRSAAGLWAWLDARPEAWRDAIAWAVLDLSGPWRLAFDTMLPDARRHPGRGSVPSHQVGQPASRRGPTPRAERDTRPPGPQGRPPLSVPAPADQGRRTPRRPRPHQASRAPRGGRPSR
ncbi:MAG: transposase [Acidimicrobiia bacterium]|nr:transposase [Acidimicrobiia bacterium]